MSNKLASSKDQVIQTKSKMTLQDYLQKHRISPEDKDKVRPTHTALPNPGIRGGGSYNIPAEKMADFLEAYYTDVFVNKQLYHITEAHHPEVSPILIDLDFRQKINQNPNLEKLYKKETIEVYLEKYYKILQQYVDPSVLNQDTALAFVMEKDKATKLKEVVKDGVHIVFPNLCPSYRVQFLARYDMVEDDDINDLFKNLKMSNDVRDIIDLSVVKTNNWFMYGSTKPGSPPYQITRIYDLSSGKCVEVDSSKYKISKNLIKLLSISNKIDIAPIRLGCEESIKNKYNNIPEKDRDPNDRNGNKNANSSKGNTKPIKASDKKINLNQIDDDELAVCKELATKCLCSRRATGFNEWIRVCWCLSNIDHRLKDSFIEFSKKASKGKFDSIGCENEWSRSQSRIKERKLGIGTLHKWAREDNPTAYKEICRISTEQIMIRSLNKSHTDVARYIYEKYKHEFKCSSITNHRWYQYRNHRWVLNEKGNALKKKISAEVSTDYSEYASLCHKKSCEYEDTPEKDNWQRKGHTASEICLSLKKRAFKNPIFEECQELFFDEEFEEELDSNDNLLHFLNGVYDLDEEEFREGYPEDNVSLTTGINYLETLEADDYQKMTKVEEFLELVLPVERVRTYVLNLLASFLHGANKEQKFHIWTGVGSNGKSMLIDLYKKTVGDYYGSMSITALTQGRGASENASPVLAETRGKRFISLDEAETNDEIKVGFMKQLTGGDEITARKLHCSPITFRPKFKLVLTCNELPSIPATDEGTWRRIRVVNFPSKFCDKPNPNIQYQFKVDRTLQGRIPEWTEVFMYMLIKYYQESYKKNGIVEPSEVTKNTEVFKSDSDQYSLFVSDKLRPDPNSSLSLDEINVVFKDFVRENSLDTRKYGRRELEKHLQIILGKRPGRRGAKWSGWKIATGEDDDVGDDGDNEIAQEDV
jgi:P4 family phage/plasmid primase-like protien